MGSRRWMDMPSRRRFHCLTCRCLRRRASTSQGAPCSLPDTSPSSLLPHRCLQTMSCPRDNPRMLPLTWLQTLKSTCQYHIRCTPGYPERQRTFPPDKPRTMLPTWPHSPTKTCRHCMACNRSPRRCLPSRGMCPPGNLDTHLLVRRQRPRRIYPQHTNCKCRLNPLRSRSKMNRQRRGHTSLLSMLLGRKSMCPRHRTRSLLLLGCRLKSSTCQRRTRGMSQLSLPRARANTFRVHSPGTRQLSWRQWTQNTCLGYTADNRPLIGCLLCLEICQLHRRCKPPWNWLQ